MTERALRRWVTFGHLRSASLLEDREAASETIAAFRLALGDVPVLLRPVDAGLTVMSLDAERCESMISVGAPGGGGRAPVVQRAMAHATECGFNLQPCD